MNKGIELERVAHKFLWYNGFYVRTRTDVWIENRDIKETKITDIDVLGYKLGDFTKLQKVLIDCKSNEKGFNQILRVSTLKKHFNINTTILVRERINQRARYLANKFEHKIIEAQKIKNEFQKYPDVGSFKKEVYEKKLEIESKLKDQRVIKREILFGISDIVLEENPYKKFKLCYARFNDAIDLFEKIKEEDIKESIKWLMIDIYMLAWLSLVLITSDLSDCPQRYKKVELENKFVEKWTTKNKIIEVLKTIAGKSFEKMNKELPFDPKPTYLNTILNITNSLEENKDYVDKILRINDYIIHENILLNNSKVNLFEIKKIFNLNDNFLSILPALNEQLLNALKKRGSIPPEFLQLI